MATTEAPMLNLRMEYPRSDKYEYEARLVRLNLDEEVVEEKEEKHIDIWDVLPPRLQKREGEDKKAYNKRINSEFLWLNSVESIDWQSLQVTVDDIADIKKATKALGIQLEDDDVLRFENGYTEELNVKCSGLQAIAILYYMDRRED